MSAMYPIWFPVLCLAWLAICVVWPRLDWCKIKGHIPMLKYKYQSTARDIFSYTCRRCGVHGNVFITVKGEEVTNVNVNDNPGR